MLVQNTQVHITLFVQSTKCSSFQTDNCGFQFRRLDDKYPGGIDVNNAIKSVLP